MNDVGLGFDVRDIVDAMAPAVAYVAVKSAMGTESVGTAFHVGRGVFATARHVVEGNTITALAVTHRRRDEASNRPLFAANVVESTTSARTIGMPYVSPRVDADVALIETNLQHLPAVELGAFQSDLVDPPSAFLSRIILFGYPPIPMSMSPEPVLIAASGEINAVVGPSGRTRGFSQAIISPAARGGFSGAPVVLVRDTERIACIGMVTESRVHGSKPEETGFMAAVDASAIRACLREWAVAVGLNPFRLPSRFSDSAAMTEVARRRRH